MRADANAVLFRERHGRLHRSGVSRMKSARDICHVDDAHELGVVPEGVKAEGLTHI
jgi:hypothetical protein